MVKTLIGQPMLNDVQPPRIRAVHANQDIAQMLEDATTIQAVDLSNDVMAAVDGLQRPYVVDTMMMPLLRLRQLQMKMMMMGQTMSYCHCDEYFGETEGWHCPEKIDGTRCIGTERCDIFAYAFRTLRIPRFRYKICTGTDFPSVKKMIQLIKCNWNKKQ